MWFRSCPLTTLPEPPITVPQGCGWPVHPQASFSLLSVVLFLSWLGVVVGADSALAQISDSVQPDFDVASTLRNAPLLRTSLGLSWQMLSGASDGPRIEAAVDIRTIFRIALDVTRLHQPDSDHDILATFGTIRGLVRVPLDRLSLATGGGWTWRSALDPASGPASYLAVEYRPTQPLALDIASESSFVDRRLDQSLDLGVSAGIDFARLRVGYRWLSLGVENFSGPTIGFGARF